MSEGTVEATVEKQEKLVFPKLKHTYTNGKNEEYQVLRTEPVGGRFSFIEDYVWVHSKRKGYERVTLAEWTKWLGTKGKVRAPKPKAQTPEEKSVAGSRKAQAIAQKKANEAKAGK